MVGVCSARQQAQQEGGSLLVSLASCLLECVYSLIDYLTKFATVRMAITGEAFLESARRATDLLARNFLKVHPTSLLCFFLLPAAALSAALSGLLLLLLYCCCCQLLLLLRQQLMLLLCHLLLLWLKVLLQYS